MSKKKELVPKRRFKEFENAPAWKQRKLMNLYKEGASGGTPNTSKTEYYNGCIPFLGISDITNSNGYIHKTEKTITIEGLNNSTSWLVPSESISLAMYASVGKVAILKTNVATSQAFYNMVFNDLTKRDFIFQYLLKTEVENGWEENISTGTQGNLNAAKVKSFKVNIPISSKEQRKISDFLFNLDNLITRHQRKLEKMKELKKSYLSEMFPAEGERKPKRRFAGFTDDWEQRKLGDVAQFSKGRGYARNDLRPSGKEIILYGSLYTAYQTLITSSNCFVHEKDNSVFSTGKEIVVPSSGETAEDIARASAVQKAGIILGGDLNIIHPIEEINPIFLALEVTNGSPKYELEKMAQGKSVVHIHNSDLSEIVISYPDQLEQKKIEVFFAEIDSIITLHQRKLEKLKNIKKAYLNEMFPRTERE